MYLLEGYSQALKFTKQKQRVTLDGQKEDIMDLFGFSDFPIKGSIPIVCRNSSLWVAVVTTVLVLDMVHCFFIWNCFSSGISDTMKR